MLTNVGNRPIIRIFTYRIRPSLRVTVNYKKISPMMLINLKVYRKTIAITIYNAIKLL